MSQSASLFAHAVITDTSLTQEPVKPQSAIQLRLQFNSGIETSLSKVLLISKGDKQEPLAFRKGTKPGEILVKIPPLSEGSYVLNYKVFAADGHLTEDILRFTVGRAEK